MILASKLKKLRKVAEKLSYRVQIAEQKQRLAELQQSSSAQPMGFVQRKETIMYAGGKPNPGTKADKRLKENKPKPGGNRPATPPGQVRKAGK